MTYDITVLPDNYSKFAFHFLTLLHPLFVGAYVLNYNAPSSL